MTYGEIRGRVAREVPGCDLKLIDGYLQDRHTAILDRLNWKRLRVDYVIQTTAPYQTGLVTATAGSAAVTIAGGTFTAGMTGRVMRFESRTEPYEFTYVGAGSGTLDRPFEGSTGAYVFQLVQSVYSLPAEARIVESARLLDADRPLRRLSKSEMDMESPSRGALGVPTVFAAAPDLVSDPPVLQIEFYPIPDAVYSIAIPYILEQTPPSATATSILPWLRPSALVAGAKSDALEHLKDYAGADRAQIKYEGYVADMVRGECFQRGAQPLKLARWMTKANLKQNFRNAGSSTGPRLP